MVKIYCVPKFIHFEILKIIWTSTYFNLKHTLYFSYKKVNSITLNVIKISKSLGWTPFSIVIIGTSTSRH